MYSYKIKSKNYIIDFINMEIKQSTYKMKEKY